MNVRSLRNGAIVVATLGALTGLGTMVASASTRPGAGGNAAAQGNQADPGGNQADQRDNQADQRGNVSPSPFDPDVSPSPFDPNASQAAGNANTNACVAVRLVNTQQNDDAQLCTTVQRAGQVRVSLTAPAGVCQDTVTLRLATQQGGGALTEAANCAGNGSATATFTLGQQATNGSTVCGSVVADNRFAAAQACVRIAA